MSLSFYTRAALRRPTLLLLCCVVFFACVARADDPTAVMDGVLDLTTETFDAQVGKTAAALVEFYAPWCGYCKRLVPEYTLLGATVKAAGADKPIIVAKVDATQHKDLATRFSVSGYPTLLYFAPGSTTPETYSGERTAEAFVSFLNERNPGLQLTIKREPTYAVELNKDNFDAVVMDPAKHAFVMFYAPWCGHCKTLHPVYEKLAKIFKSEPDLVIAKLNADDPSNAVVRYRYKVEGFPTLAFLPKDDKKNPEYYEGARDLETLLSFVNARAYKDRRVTGDLDSSVGVFEDVSAILRKIMEEGKTEEEKKELYAQFQQALSEVHEEAATQYQRIAAKVMELGASFIDKEVERVDRILSGTLSDAKRDSMIIRINILFSLRAKKDEA